MYCNRFRLDRGAAVKCGTLLGIEEGEVLPLPSPLPRMCAPHVNITLQYPFKRAYASKSSTVCLSFAVLSYPGCSTRSGQH